MLAIPPVQYSASAVHSRAYKTARDLQSKQQYQLSLLDLKLTEIEQFHYCQSKRNIRDTVKHCTKHANMYTPPTCHHHATYMPPICHPYATYMPTCMSPAYHLHAIYMSPTWHQQATYMSSTVPANLHANLHVTCMPSCHLHTTNMPPICQPAYHPHAMYMPPTCHLHIPYLPGMVKLVKCELIK
jgi:hypothetical protein